MKRNYLLISLIIIGAILFGIVSFVVIKSTRTTSAVVPIEGIRAGDNITEDMLTVIQVPVSTPSNYIIDMSSLIGQKLKIDAEPGQLLYMSDVIMSWDDIVYGASIPNDYIVTALKIPNERAVGGLIVAGDTVDILGVQNSSASTSSQNSLDDLVELNNAIGPISKYSYGADGINVYWVLANVKILETNSSLSGETDGMLSNVIGEDNTGDSSYFIVALSYADYKKVVLAQQYLDLWVNLSPVWNNDNPPLLDLMQYSEIQGLMDSQAQSILEVIEKDGETTYEIKQEELDKLEEARERLEERDRDRLRRQELIDTNIDEYDDNEEEDNEVDGEE